MAELENFGAEETMLHTSEPNTPLFMLVLADFLLTGSYGSFTSPFC